MILHIFIKFLAGVSFIVPLTSTDAKRCETFWVNEYEYNKSYDLKLVNGILYDYTFSTYDHRESINLINFENNEKPQSDDYFVKLPATFKSFRGEIHVAFSEYPQTENSNRVYEFVLGGYGNTLFEIRRKDYLHEKRDFNGNRFADYSVPTKREFNVEFSITKSGVVQIEDVASNFKFNLTDQLPVIPVKYVSFAGYGGAPSQVIFNCVNATQEQGDPETENNNEPYGIWPIENEEELYTLQPFNFG